MGDRLHFLVLADIGRSAGLAMGGVAHKPCRIAVAEQALIGKTASPENFARTAEILLRGPHGYEHNHFKIELAKQGGVRALAVAALVTSEVEWFASRLPRKRWRGLAGSMCW